MIITRTPLRISLVGGGTDMPSFYNVHGGAVVSFAITKYIYISVNEKYDGKTRVSYSKNEIVDDPSELEHDIVRETLRFFGEKGLEITSVADVPAYGTGLGSSSSFAVGLIRSISARHGNRYPPKMLAETAYTIESDLCQNSVGKQDHYAAAFGGLHFYEFSKGNVSVEPIEMTSEQKEYMESHMMLFHFDRLRNSEKILSGQQNNLGHKRLSIESAKKMRDLAYDMCDLMKRGGDFKFVGRYLHTNWELKKNLSNDIADKEIDRIYIKAIRAGAVGGKLCGAGGGGFFLFWVDPKKHNSVRDALGLRQVFFGIENEGSKVIYDSTKPI